MEIKDWDWNFSFGVNPPRDREGPYYDLRHLHLRGNLLRPAKISVREVELIFLPRRELNEDERTEHESENVGSLELYHGRMIGLLSIPSDALLPVLQMMIGSRFRFVVLGGDRLRYRRAAIRTYRLEMTINEDDLPFEE